MKEWHILYTRYAGGERHYIVLRSFQNVLFWFVTTSWKCSDIKIFVT